MYWHTVPALSLVRSRSERGKMWGGLILATWLLGVAQSGDDFTKFSRIYQWFQTLIHPLIQQRQKNHDLVARYGGEEFTVILSNTPG